MRDMFHKDGRKTMADSDQFATLKASGWSFDKPKGWDKASEARAAAKAEAAAEAAAGSESAEGEGSESDPNAGVNPADIEMSPQS